MSEETLKNETLLIGRIIKEPVVDHVRLLYNHFSRYDSAIRKLAVSREDSVIDASCGYGYGSFILSTKAERVFALDVNKEYLEVAKRMFHFENIKFFNYEEFDILRSKSEIPKADKIVCIETFEHIPKNEAFDFVKRLLLFLRPGGHMFLTVPLGNNEPSTYNEYHLNEPSIDYLYNLFARSFREISFEINTFRNSFGYETDYCHVTLNCMEDKNEIR